MINMSQTIQPPSSSPGLSTYEEQLITLLAKRKKIPIEQAQIMIGAFKDEHGGKLDEFSNALAMLGVYGDQLGKLPPSFQDPISRLITQRMSMAAFNPPPAAPTEAPMSTVDKIMLMKQAMSGTDDEKLAELNKKIDAMAANQEKRQLQDFVTGITTQMQKMQDAQEQRFAQIEQKLQIGQGLVVNPATGQPVSAAEAVYAELIRTQQTKENILKALGLAEQVAGNRMSTEEMRKAMEASGYKVTGPMTVTEFEQRMERMQRENDEKMAALVMQAKEQAKQEALADGKRTEMMIQFGSTALETISSLIAPGEGGKAVAALTGLIKGASKAIAPSVTPATTAAATTALTGA